MTIAIVIGTHGWAAEQLLKTAEMLLGEQENVGWIDFVPGENAETLIEAQQHPQTYQTLSLRVSGWSARFVTMNKEWQDMRIDTAK